MEKISVCYTLEKYGENEPFFAQKNKACMELEEKSPVNDSIKKKYEMIRVLLLDQRATRDNESTEYRFYMGDKKIEAHGFFKYSHSLVRIAIEDIEEMGECLLNNEGTKVPRGFYRRTIEEIKLPGQSLIQFAEKSKQSIEKITQAFDSIKQTLFKEKKRDSIIER